MVNEILDNITKDFSYIEIFENLKKENIDDFIKIFSIINIEFIENKEDFEIFINHLTNHSTPVREITAIKLEELSKNHLDFFLNEYSKEKLIAAVIDINPNISRAICQIIEKNAKIQQLIKEDLINKIETLIKEIKEYQKEHNDFCEQKNKKSHAKNKKLFALYWFLEAFYSCMDAENNSKELEIVKFAINFHDYTIREKGAKILAKYPNLSSELLQKAKSDQNFYVKNLVYDKIYNDD